MEPIIKPQEFTAAPTVQPQHYEASGDELVSGQLSRLIGQNSPYLQSHRADAAMSAADRGMQNSSMAAGWGEKAAIDAALPIAQADAGYFQQRGLADQQGIIQSGLQQQQATDTAGHYGVQAGYSSQLQKQEADARSDLSTQEFGQQGRLQTQAERASLTQSKQEQDAHMAREQLAQNANTTRMHFEQAMAQRIASMELSQKDQSDLQSALRTYGDTAQRAINEIMQNDNLTPEAQKIAIQRIEQDHRTNVNLSASLAGVRLRWS